MKLVIHAHALKNESLTQAITGHFDERGGTIGRSDTNTLTLPDPERHVSRLQAEVVFAGKAFSIRNVGSANPIELNGRTLRPGEGAPLAPGDQLVIGGYAMRVVAEKTVPGAPGQVPRVDSRTVVRASAGEARTDPPPRATAPAAAAAAGSAQRRVDPVLPSSDDPFSDLATGPGASASASDPFADLLAPSPGFAASAPAPLPPVRARPGPVPTTRPVAELDPFADLAPPTRGNTSPGAAPGSSSSSDLLDFMQAPAAAPAASKRLPSDPGLDDLLGIPASGSGASAGSGLDSLFGLGGQGSGKDGAALLDEFLAPSKPAGAGAPGDVLDLFAERPAAGPKAPAAFDHTPELAGAYAPPTVKMPPPPAPRKPAAPPPQAALITPLMPTVRAAPSPRAAAAPVTPAAAPASASADGGSSPQALWRAFCEGAGLNMPLQQGLSPQLMRVMGQVMHHAVEGALKLVASRAAAKQELRAQVTTIQSKNNNPLSSRSTRSRRWRSCCSRRCAASCPGRRRCVMRWTTCSATRSAPWPARAPRCRACSSASSRRCSKPSSPTRA